MSNISFGKESEKDKNRLCASIHHGPKSGPANWGFKKGGSQENLRGKGVGKEHDWAGGTAKGTPFSQEVIQLKM